MSGKYWEKYQEKRMKLERTCKTPTHMTDKQAYISALEAQVDRSGHSNVMVTTFAERIEQLQRQLNVAEERIANLMRSVKLQGVESGKDNEAGLGRLEERIAALEKLQKTKNDSFKAFSESVDDALRGTERKIVRLIEEFEEKYKRSSGAFSFGGDFTESLGKEKEKVIREAAESAWLAQQTCNKLAEDALNRVTGCEKRIKEIRAIFDSIEIPNVDDIEIKVTANLDRSIENLSGLIKGYISSQESLSQEFKDFKSKVSEVKDPGVFSFGSASPKPFEVIESKSHTRVKSESNSREQSKEVDLRITRKRSSSPGIKTQPEKKPKKEEVKNKKKAERKNKLEKLYRDFNEKNS